MTMAKMLMMMIEEATGKRKNSSKFANTVNNIFYNSQSVSHR